MKQTLQIILTLLLLISGTSFGKDNSKEFQKNWPTWRGPRVSGEAPQAQPPLTWSETQNVRWKIPIPGKGLSTPVIWGKQIFITSAVPTDKKVELPKKEEAPDQNQGRRPMAPQPEYIQQFVVMSINREDGKILWQKVVREQLPHEGHHPDGSWASNSCVTDGEYLIAFFGSYGIYCFNMKGKLLWEKDFGDLKIRASFGAGSSPALYQKYLIVNWDNEEASFIYVLDKKTGNILWQKPREEKTSWTTPLVVEVNGTPQVVVAATKKSIGYNLADGEEIWWLSGMTESVIPTPIYQNGLLYLISGFRGAALQAVNLSQAKGDLKDTPAVVWTIDKNTPYVPSPLLYEGKLYYLKGNNESLTCTDAKTGEIHYTLQNLEGMKGVYASPVGAAGRIYVVGRNGLVFAIKPGPQFEVLAQNTLEDGFDASPALVGKELYLRGLKSLYCIAEK